MSIRVIAAPGADYNRWLTALMATRSAAGEGVEGAVAAIVETVRERGDQALLELTARYDQVSLTLRQLKVGQAQLRQALEQTPAGHRRGLELAARRIRDFHQRTLEHSFSYRDRFGMKLGQQVNPLDRVGIYVPGGTGAYPSTVLMNAIPAKVAGVKEVVMVSPIGPDGHRQAVLAAAAIAGVDEVYSVGGAQAVAALAYGTKTIHPVDKIVGPGNVYVQAAKRMVYGVTDIDKIAGPSEVLVIADETANPHWVAADLIAQAEHGSGEESAILLTVSRRLADGVLMALEQALADLPRAAAVQAVLDKRGAVVLMRTLAEACELANRLAPEHLELSVRSPARWAAKLKAAGAIFIGALSPAALGDYLAGPNHVLPTGGAARFASPLGAYDFIRRTSIIEANRAALKALGPVVAELARMEGFEGHARAMEQRLSKPGRRPARNGS